MLVLSRRRGECLIVGGVIISVVEFRGDKVRIGIDAPDDVMIVRGEIVGREARESRDCQSSQPGDPPLPPPNNGATAEVRYDRSKRQWRAIITDPATPNARPVLFSPDLGAIRDLLDRQGIGIS